MDHIEKVADSDHEPVPDLAVYAYLGLDEYVGISGRTGVTGQVTLMLPEGTYRFKTDQYGIDFWSSQIANCNTPTECTTASITVIGRDYLANEQTIKYTYDDLNRLTAADYDLGLYYHYEYDSVGNRLSQETAYKNTPITTAYTYDDANRLTTAGGQSYSFDANGNLLSDGTYTYSYDTANRLVGVATAATAVTYRYNGDGKRVQQTTGGTTTNYTLELNSGLSQVLADGTNTYLYGMNRLGMSNTAGNYLYEYDALGSVRQMENIAGITLAESYDPYGNVILSSGQAGMYGYTGEMQDSSTGLVYLRTRTFNPTLGTFTSRDTWDGDAKSPMSYNRWMYSYGNPVKYTDPSGRCVDGISTVICAMIVGAIGGGLIGGGAGVTYGKAVYQMAVNGKCKGCSADEILKHTENDFIKMVGVGGVAIGASFGATAGLGPDIAMLAGIGGMGLGLASLDNAMRRLQANPNDDCAKLDAGLSLFIIGFSFYGGLSAYNKVNPPSVPTEHGNSLNSTKTQTGYEIYDITTGDVVKTGISGGKLTNNGTVLPRAASQVSKWNKEVGTTQYAYRIVVRDMPDRMTALKWEKYNAYSLKEQGNSLSRHVFPRPDDWKVK